MSLPHLLLVDDSQAVLAYEQAALSALYALSVASNGMEAIQKARALRPDGILLDLSMPEMDGDEVLAALKADQALAEIPVIVISSSEDGRADACLKAGAAAYLAKPIQALQLRALVARTLDQAQEKGRRGSLAVLMVRVGSIELGVPLENVQQVLPQLPTRLLPFGPTYLRETFDLGDEPVCVLDLAVALGVDRRVPLLDRKLVVLRHAGVLLSLSVDTVPDPLEFLPRDVISPDRFGGAAPGELARLLRAVVRSEKGPLAVVNPAALLTTDLVQDLRRVVAEVADGSAIATETT
jgi:CheY-like chemotaxis protein